MARNLLFVREDGRRKPNGREVCWAWALWLPVAGVCFYSAWGYATSGAPTGTLTVGLVILIGLVGIGSLAPPLVKTWRWQKLYR